MEFLNGSQAAKALGCKSLGRAEAKRLGIEYIDGPLSHGKRSLLISRDEINLAIKRKAVREAHAEAQARELEQANALRGNGSDTRDKIEVFLTYLVALERKMEMLAQALARQEPLEQKLTQVLEELVPEQKKAAS